VPRTRCLHSSLRWSMYNTPFKWSNLIRSARVQNRVARSPEPRMHAHRRTAGAANRSRRAADGWRAVLVQEHASEPPIQLERYWLAIGGQRCHLPSAPWSTHSTITYYYKGQGRSAQAAGKGLAVERGWTGAGTPE
jgi:hypothetical protein